MAKRKILIIDDEIDFSSMVKMNLEDFGDFDVKTESRPRQGLNAALDFRPDLIFLDVIMPGMEGPDVFQQIKAHNEIKDTPVIFLTASITKEELAGQKGMIGGRPFIAKPSSPIELVACIEKNVPIETPSDTL